MPDANFILAPTKTAFQIALAPVQNAINSLVLLNKAENLSGLDDWVTRTVAGLPPDRLRTHKIVFIGLYYAVEPVGTWPSFPDYINYLSEQDPISLRDRVFAAYEMVFAKYHTRETTSGELPPLDLSALLASRDAFLAYLRERFSPEHVHVEIETEAHALLNDPPAMKETIVSHLNYMWSEVFAAEWERVTPLLQDCVDAFDQVDFSGMTNIEAARFVIGQDPQEWWAHALDQAKQVIFVPSAHLGPYLGRFSSSDDQTVWLLFGARLPQGVQSASPDLSRSELLVRLQAVADDTRLRILQLLIDQGEQCSQDIIRTLNLSQSAASRHLQQLSATGYLAERRREGAKCYNFNKDRAEDTIQAFARFLHLD